MKVDRALGGASQLKWEAPDEEALVEFMVKEKGFRCGRAHGGWGPIAEC